MKKMNKRKISFFIVIIIIIIIFLVKINPKEKEKIDVNPIIGSWESSGGTIYKFEENNNGTMVVPLADYKFIYEIKDTELSIDYNDENSNDVVYEYNIDNNNLILKGKKGTFVLKKVNE